MEAGDVGSEAWRGVVGVSDRFLQEGRNYYLGRYLLRNYLASSTFEFRGPCFELLRWLLRVLPEGVNISLKFSHISLGLWALIMP